MYFNLNVNKISLKNQAFAKILSRQIAYHNYDCMRHHKGFDWLWLYTHAELESPQETKSIGLLRIVQNIVYLEKGTVLPGGFLGVF